METKKSAQEYLLHLINRLDGEEDYDLEAFADDLEEYVEELRENQE